MEFRNKYDSTAEFITEPGSQFTPEYSPTIDKNGNIDLKQVGEINHYEQIQSHADSVDINNIMLRYEMGETNILNRRNGAYLDVTDMPKNLTEHLQKIIIANNEFENLPAEIKNKYNCVEEWLDDLMTNVLNNNIQPKEDIKEDETKNE